MRALTLKLDANGRGTFEIPASDHVTSYVLAAGVPKSVAVPVSARYVFFSATGDFFARFGGSAAIPAADVTDGSGSEVNPTHRALDAVQTIGLVAQSACIVSMSWYAQRGRDGRGR